MAVNLFHVKGTTVICGIKKQLHPISEFSSKIFWEYFSLISLRVFLLLKFGNQSIQIGASVLLYECTAIPGTGAA
jgi:hypothetical protein